jgi:type II secretory ATPase GspE/PulE/Tfp pilus assembly ATPase PilB-like protein
MADRFSLRDLGANAGQQPAQQPKQPHPQPKPQAPQQQQARVQPAPPQAQPQARPQPAAQQPARTQQPAQKLPLPQPKPQQKPHSTAVALRDTIAAHASSDASASFSVESMRGILLELGVKSSHVNIAMRRASQTGEPLAQIMRDFGFLSGEGVARAVSRQTQFEYFSPERVDQIDKAALEGMTLPEFKRFVPVGRDDEDRLLVAVPDASVVNEALNAFYAQKARVVVASEHTIQSVYRKYFANTEAAFDDAIAKFMKAIEAGRRKEDEEQSIGLVRDVYFALLRHSCYSGASDLYLYKSEYVGIVRLKINGVGQIFRTIDMALYDRLLNKLVQDNTKADDLRIRPKEAVVEFSDEDREKHSDIATRFGFRLELTESRGVRGAVIRILDKNSSATDLELLGFDEYTYKTISRVSRTSTGFFLVTGPTGSGKTTTLYALLKSIDAVERSVQSIENPIEYKHGLWQQFELRKDSTNESEDYNEWLKALLRNAPDVILVGEVRDRHVANVCLNAANTGHLVFATLHTNDAVMAVARLKSLEIDLDVLGSVLLGILAQRLVRLLCKDCRKPDTSEDTFEGVNEPYLKDVHKQLHRAGDGCPNCDFTGYRGRRMIYEVLEMNGAVRQALEQGAPPSVISKEGLPRERTMWANGLRLVATGLTSLEELQRVATKNY